MTWVCSPWGIAFATFFMFENRGFRGKLKEIRDDMGIGEAPHRQLQFPKHRRIEAAEW
jgi:hypothetical protein